MLAQLVAPRVFLGQSLRQLRCCYLEVARTGAGYAGGDGSDGGGVGQMGWQRINLHSQLHDASVKNVSDACGVAENEEDLCS